MGVRMESVGALELSRVSTLLKVYGELSSMCGMPEYRGVRELNLLNCIRMRCWTDGWSLEDPYRKGRGVVHQHRSGLRKVGETGICEARKMRGG